MFIWVNMYRPSHQIVNSGQYNTVLAPSRSMFSSFLLDALPNCLLTDVRGKKRLRGWPIFNCYSVLCFDFFC